MLSINCGQLRIGPAVGNNQHHRQTAAARPLFVDREGDNAAAGRMGKGDRQGAGRACVRVCVDIKGSVFILFVLKDSKFHTRISYVSKDSEKPTPN